MLSVSFLIDFPFLTVNLYSDDGFGFLIRINKTPMLMLKIKCRNILDRMIAVFYFGENQSDRTALKDNSKPGVGKTRHSPAFTLVEVTMALGIVSCSLLVIVGLLPVGLQTLNESAVQYGMSTISQKISSELQEIPFDPSSSNPTYAITQLSGTNYYTREGVMTTSTDSYRFFSVSFSTLNSSVPGATATYPQSIKTVRATVAYPVLAPIASQQSNILTFLTARQSSL